MHELFSLWVTAGLAKGTRAGWRRIGKHRSVAGFHGADYFSDWSGKFMHVDFLRSQPSKLRGSRSLCAVPSATIYLQSSTYLVDQQGEISSAKLLEGCEKRGSLFVGALSDSVCSPLFIIGWFFYPLMQKLKLWDGVCTDTVLVLWARCTRDICCDLAIFRNLPWPLHPLCRLYPWATLLSGWATASLMQFFSRKCHRRWHSIQKYCFQYSWPIR